MQEAIDLHKITTGLDGVLHPHDSIAQEHVEEVLQEKKMRSASFEVDQTFLFNSLGLPSIPIQMAESATLKAGQWVEDR